MADLAATAVAFGIPSLGVWKSYLILPKFFAVPSMIASSFLARDVMRKRRETGAITLNNGALLGLAVVNVVGSFFGWFMTTWMAPKGDAPYAAGNQATCNAQGFFVSLQFIYFVTAYTLLAALYMLTVRFSWTEDYMKQAKIRLTFLLLPIGISFSFAVAPLFYEMYNIATVFCYLAPYPPGCERDADVDCTRGNKGALIRTVQFMYTMACNAAIVVFMAVLLHSVYARERRLDRYLVSGQGGSRVQTGKTAWQGLRYIGAFTLAYFWVYIFMVWGIAGTVRGTGYCVVFYVHVVLNPLAGLFNALVYFSPRYRAHRGHSSRKSRMDCVFLTLHVSAPTILARRPNRKESARSTIPNPIPNPNAPSILARRPSRAESASSVL